MQQPMHVITAIVLALTRVGCVMGIFTTSKCADSMVDGLIKADCQRRSLVNIVDVRLDTHTKLLDLSHNDFTTLVSNQFLSENLRNLEQIILQNNQIERIDSQAFNGLSLLHVLDLSMNRIRTFSLAYVPPLRTLNMSYNPLDENFRFYSSTLEVLDLESCTLPAIPMRDYSDLPKLRHLNLSYNRIEYLFLQSLQHMHLRTIKFSGNPIKCTADTEKVLNWLNRQGIEYSPICPHLNQQLHTYPKIPNSRNQPVFIQPQTLPTTSNEASANIVPAHNECVDQLNLFKKEQRFIAIISLAIHLLILVLVVIFFSVYLSHTCKRGKNRKTNQEQAQGNSPEIEADFDSEPPPPPYRSGVYTRGFQI